MAKDDSIQAVWSAVTAVRKGLDELEAVLLQLVEDAAIGRGVRAAISDKSVAGNAAAALVRARAGALGSRPTPNRTQGKNGRRGNGRTAAETREKKILAALGGKKDGLSSRDLSSATGIKGEALGYRLGVLRKQKKVRIEGQRRAARYFLAS